MGHPNSDITFGIPLASSDGRYYSRYPQGDRFGVPGNASGGLAVASTLPPTGNASVGGLGGVVNGELYSNDFTTGTSGLVRWGNPEPVRAMDPAALDGWALRYDWVAREPQDPRENYNGASLNHNIASPPGGRKSMYCRIRFRLGSANARIDGIQKIIRYRSIINGVSDIYSGTLNIQWGTFLFNGDNYGNGNNHVQFANTINSHGPATFRNTYRWLEFFLSYENPSRQVARAWVDGTLIIDTTVNLNTPMPSNQNMNYIMFLGTYNNPADTRSDWIDKIDVSDSFMGVP